MNKTNYLLLTLVLIIFFSICLNALDVTVGAGDQLNRKPFDFYYRYSLYETLYYPDEISSSGYITGISFYNNFSSTIDSNGHIELWLGITDQPDLSSGWIGSNQLTMVYNHHVAFPAGQNEINLTLNEPFLYSGGNLILLARTPGNTTWSGEPLRFYCQTRGATRARDFYSNETNANHVNPPMAGDYLALSGQFPKTTFHFSETLPAVDLGISYLTGPDDLTDGREYTYVATVDNYGTEMLTSYTVKLFGWDDRELATANGSLLESGNSAEVPLAWTPDGDAGYTNLYAKVILTGDQNSFNDISQTLDVVIHSESGGGFENLGSLSGNIRDNLGEPITSANIQISDYSLVGVPDENGSYSFAWLQPGLYQVTASAMGYNTQIKSANILATHNTNLDFDLHLASDLTLSGRVIKSTDQSQGIANATVEIIGSVNTAVGTDELGYFSIYDLPINQTFLFRAMHPNYVIYKSDITLAEQNLDLGDIVLENDPTPNEDPLSDELAAMSFCYPNPFVSTTSIFYKVKQPAQTKLEIYNIKGQKVICLSDYYAKASNYTVTWNGSDSKGNQVVNGIYFYKLSIGNNNVTRKIVLLK